MTDDDIELSALRQAIEAMEALPSKDAQARVIAYLIARFDIDLEDL